MLPTTWGEPSFRTSVYLFGVVDEPVLQLRRARLSQQIERLVEVDHAGRSLLTLETVESLIQAAEKTSDISQELSDFAGLPLRRNLALVGARMRLAEMPQGAETGKGVDPSITVRGNEVSYSTTSLKLPSGRKAWTLVIPRT